MSREILSYKEEILRKTTEIKYRNNKMYIHS